MVLLLNIRKVGLRVYFPNKTKKPKRKDTVCPGLYLTHDTLNPMIFPHVKMLYDLKAKQTIEA